ncbi:ferritin family protein [Aquabacterium humicola]|uniref:ferritin family protein n=1 Tax=Aquabacterium humicola TaxID=3237377 RepID=UPI0025437EB2|nr:ferritin family protein [Rubrivivax pictus]
MSGPRPDSIDALIAAAFAMEQHAARRYAELADTMEACNNREVAALFRKMAGYEAEHAEAMRRRLATQDHPPAFADPELDGPETVPTDALHYLMHPWHALQLAMAAERRAHDFFAKLAEGMDDGELRRATLALQREEAEHIALLEDWIERYPPPDKDWSLDPDPPRYND